MDLGDTDAGDVDISNTDGVAIGPKGVGRVVTQVPSEEGVRQRRKGHWRAGVTALGFWTASIARVRTVLMHRASSDTAAASCARDFAWRGDVARSGCSECPGGAGARQTTPGFLQGLNDRVCLSQLRRRAAGVVTYLRSCSRNETTNR